MKSFIVSYLSFFDNVIIMQKVDALDKEFAVRKVLFDLDPSWGEGKIAEMSYDDLVKYAFDGDLAIGAIEI